MSVSTKEPEVPAVALEEELNNAVIEEEGVAELTRVPEFVPLEVAQEVSVKDALDEAAVVPELVPQGVAELENDPPLPAAPPLLPLSSAVADAQAREEMDIKPVTEGDAEEDAVEVTTPLKLTLSVGMGVPVPVAAAL